MSEETRKRQATQAAIRAIRSGERPVYRVLHRPNGWYVLGYGWLAIDANDRRSAVEATSAAVAEWLDVSPNAFDVVSDGAGAKLGTHTAEKTSSER